MRYGVEGCILWGAYGLIDAPYMWYTTLNKELEKLGFTYSPFDPCVHVLRHPETGALAGVLGIQVDDSLGRGDNFFAKQIDALERRSLSGASRVDNLLYTRTGI